MTIWECARSVILTTYLKNFLSPWPVVERSPEDKLADLY